MVVPGPLPLVSRTPECNLKLNKHPSQTPSLPPSLIHPFLLMSLKKASEKTVVAIAGPVQGHRGQELFPGNVNLLCRPCKPPIAPRGGWLIVLDLKRGTILSRILIKKTWTRKM